MTKKEYKDMTYQDKLDYFGLPENFTEEDLKKKYRELSRDYHPDLMAGKSEAEKEEAKAIFQLINNINEDLKKHIKEKTINIDNPFDELFNSQKTEYQRNLESLIENPKLRDKKYPSYYDDTINEINVLIGLFNKNVKALYSNNGINKLYNLIYDKIKECYKQLCKRYCDDCKLKYECQEYFKIDETIIEWNCPIRVLYEQLETAKNKVTEKHINGILERYKEEECLEVFRTSVERLVKKAIEEYNNNDYSLNIMGAKFAGDIEDLIKKYQEVKSKLVNIRDFLDTTLEDSNEIKYFKDKYNLYNNNFRLGIFPNENELNDYLEKLEKFKTEYNNRKSSQIISQVMDSVTNNFNEALSDARINLDIDGIKQKTAIFSKVLEALEKAKNGEIRDDVCLLLAEITFKDIPHDIGILNSVLNNVIVLDNSNIYVKIGKIVTLFGNIFNTLKVSDGKCFLEGESVTGNYNSEEVKIEDLLNNYINLDVLLEIVPLDGRTYFDGKREITVLCGWNENVLILNSTGTLEVVDVSTIKVLLDENNQNKYQDKSYILNMVKNSINLEQKSVKI